jgi:hypothetical protein
LPEKAVDVTVAAGPLAAAHRHEVDIVALGDPLLDHRLEDLSLGCAPALRGQEILPEGAQRLRWGKAEEEVEIRVGIRVDRQHRPDSRLHEGAHKKRRERRLPHPSLPRDGDQRGHGRSRP